MLTPINITEEEKKLLLERHRLGENSLVRDKSHAVLLSNRGMSAAFIGKALFRSGETVRKWLRDYSEKRLSSLFSPYEGNTNASKLTQEQLSEITEVLRKSPDENGLPFKFWTTKGLKKWMKATFGVVYESDRSYHFLFRLSNYSWKLPETKDKRRNEEDIKKRIQEIREEIQPFLKDPHYVVLVADEVRVEWEVIVRRAWLQKGKPTILKIEREHKGQSFFGALNLQNGKCNLYKMPTQNQQEVVKVLKLLKKEYLGKKICLVWDNAPWHKGNLVKARLGKHQILANFHLIAFPPRAPEYNPQEHVWKYAKDAISNKQYNTLEETVKAFEKVVTKHRYHYKLL